MRATCLRLIPLTTSLASNIFVMYLLCQIVKQNASVNYKKCYKLSNIFSKSSFIFLVLDATIRLTTNERINQIASLLERSQIMSESKFRKFPKINRLPQEERNQAREHWATLLELIKKGKKFNITEKLDGANAGVEILKENGEITIHIADHNRYKNV